MKLPRRKFLHSQQGSERSPRQCRNAGTLCRARRHCAPRLGPDYRNLIAAETEKWAKVVKFAGVRVD
jgi:hypothetical protein